MTIRLRTLIAVPEYRRGFVRGGTFVFTLVTARRRPILTTPAGREALRTALADAARTRPVTIDAIVLLPDPQHGIWTLRPVTCPRVPEPGQWQVVPPEPAAPGCAARLATGELGYHGQEGYRTRHYDANRNVPLPTHQRPCGDLFGGEQDHPEYDPAHPAGYETASTGLMMVGAREYDPEIGRFLQPDPQPTGPELQWGQLNRWAYCANDPVNASDPSGEHPIVVFAALVLLAALTMGFVNWMSNRYLFTVPAGSRGRSGWSFMVPSPPRGWSRIFSASFWIWIDWPLARAGADLHISPRASTSGMRRPERPGWPGPITNTSRVKSC